MDKTVKRRRNSFDAPDWWRQRLFAELERRESVRSVLAEIKRRYKVNVDEAVISTFKKKNEGMTIEVARQLSDVLGIPPPIFIADSEDMARSLYAEWQLKRGATPEVLRMGAELDQEIVGAPRNGQSPGVEPEHGRRPRGPSPRG